MQRNLYCDNYRTCNSFCPDQGTKERTEARARARGWHVFHGQTMGGSDHDGILCEKCASSRRLAKPVTPLPDQQELFAGSQDS